MTAPALTETQARVLRTLGATYLRLGRPRRALLLLRPLERARPSDAAAARLRLAACLAMDLAERALTEIDRLIEHEPGTRALADAMAARARLLHRAGDAAGARAAWAERAALLAAAGAGTPRPMAPAAGRPGT